LPKESGLTRSEISLTGQYVALDEDLTGEQNLILMDLSVALELLCLAMTLPPRIV